MILYVIAASQDFSRANHRGLWESLSRMKDTDVVVANIPADNVVSRIKGHYERIQDAKMGAQQIQQHLYVFRPFLTIRPEVAPRGMYKKLAVQFWQGVERACGDLNRYAEIRVVFYNAVWAGILAGSRPHMKLGYYLFDEVRQNGSDNSINQKRYKEDVQACQIADCIFAMSQRLVDVRQEYAGKTIVLGNGADPYTGLQMKRKDKSVAFVGNFRDWIDMELFTGLVEKRKDIDFHIVGPVEDNMKAAFNQLLNRHTNVFYDGQVEKNIVATMYTMFSMIIIPYKQNDFIRATRPIKIVESVLAGTPVITIPVDGYQERSFIRFASSMETFSQQIDYLLAHPIDPQSAEYIDFVQHNTWAQKAHLINSVFEGVTKEV